MWGPWGACLTHYGGINTISFSPATFVGPESLSQMAKRRRLLAGATLVPEMSFVLPGRCHAGVGGGFRAEVFRAQA
jgi:hypothetical protein